MAKISKIGGVSRLDIPFNRDTPPDFGKRAFAVILVANWDLYYDLVPLELLYGKS